ncbi:MAG TPA: 2-phosphosulfolactate phosphatase [Gaiellales bacterium]|jgi:2-phosphosulfolactate phosphatase|nr:2-phosphosulfolactate phosphatase [Gaiellales bacterium]
MRIDVAFTPGEPPDASVAIVIDVLRATTTIAHALTQGYERVLACSGLDRARELRSRLGNGTLLAGERGCVRPEGFDFGNSPREFADGRPHGSTLVLTTTNGTRAVVAAAERADTVLVGSLANLTACAAAAARTVRTAKGDVLIQCAGVKGQFAIDDAYTAGRFVSELRVWLAEWEPSDAAQAAEAIAASFPSAADGLGASASARNLRAADLADDVRYCAREGVLDIVPTVGDVDGDVALITA